MLSVRTSIGILSLGVIAYAIIFEKGPDPLTASLALSILGFILTYILVSALGSSFISAGLTGRDRLKKDGKLLPESMGAISAVIYLFLIISFIPFPFYEYIKNESSRKENGQQHGFPHHKLAEFLSAILSIQSMVALGFIDDVFDVRWRYKLPLPIIASIPLLIVYYVNFGETFIVMPNFLRPYIGKLFELGFLYYIYMAMVATFCTNAINILAGVNGIEISQSIIIGSSIALNDILFLNQGHPALEMHLFSLYFILPFLGVSIGLLFHNWYPAKVFVGDTYCYFAGMTFAVVGILGHFSKTLLLFFLPQIFNFLYSCPQLFRIIPCPRHRMPRLNSRTGLLEPSMTSLFPSNLDNENNDEDNSSSSSISIKSLPRITTFIVQIFENLHIAKVTRLKTSSNIHSKKLNQPTHITNLTLINLLLVIFGPMSEKQLAIMICLVQITCSIIAFAIRYGLAGVLYSY